MLQLANAWVARQDLTPESLAKLRACIQAESMNDCVEKIDGIYGLSATTHTTSNPLNNEQGWSFVKFEADLTRAKTCVKQLAVILNLLSYLQFFEQLCESVAGNLVIWPGYEAFRRQLDGLLPHLQHWRPWQNLTAGYVAQLYAQAKANIDAVRQQTYLVQQSAFNYASQYVAWIDAAVGEMSNMCNQHREGWDLVNQFERILSTLQPNWYYFWQQGEPHEALAKLMKAYVMEAFYDWSNQHQINTTACQTCFDNLPQPFTTNEVQAPHNGYGL